MAFVSADYKPQIDVTIIDLQIAKTIKLGGKFMENCLILLKHIKVVDNFMMNCHKLLKKFNVT